LSWNKNLVSERIVILGISTKDRVGTRPRVVVPVVPDPAIIPGIQTTVIKSTSFFVTRDIIAVNPVVAGRIEIDTDLVIQSIVVSNNVIHGRKKKDSVIAIRVCAIVSNSIVAAELIQGDAIIIFRGDDIGYFVIVRRKKGDSCIPTAATTTSSNGKIAYPDIAGLLQEDNSAGPVSIKDRFILVLPYKNQTILRYLHMFKIGALANNDRITTISGINSRLDIGIFLAWADI